MPPRGIEPEFGARPAARYAVARREREGRAVARGEAAAARTLDVGAPQAVEVHVKRSVRRRRTIEIAIERGHVVVRAPKATTDREIDTLLRARTGWIARNLQQQPVPSLSEGTSIPVLGVPCPLTVSTGETAIASVSRDLLGLHVLLPAGVDDAAREDTIRDALTAWLRALASEVIPRAVERRAADVRRTPRRVIVRDQRRRWGSCAPDGTLRFNWRLAMLDPALIDYVVVHELAHLWEANHGPGFWRIVEQVLPEHRAVRRRLRDDGRRLPL